jgi:hypothetical protein
MPHQAIQSLIRSLKALQGNLPVLERLPGNFRVHKGRLMPHTAIQRLIRSWKPYKDFFLSLKISQETFVLIRPLSAP